MEMNSSIQLGQKDLQSLKKIFMQELSDNERDNEENLILNNSLIDPSIIFSRRITFEKLKFYFENLVYRFYIMGSSNSKSTELLNLLIEDDLLENNENLIIIVKFKDHSDCEVNQLYKLYKCKLSDNLGLSYDSSELLCEGKKQVQEFLFNYDKQFSLEKIPEKLSEFSIDNKDLMEKLSEYFLILEIPKKNKPYFFKEYENQLRCEFFLFPSNQNMRSLLDNLINFDSKYFSNFQNILLESIRKNVKNNLRSSLFKYFYQEDSNDTSNDDNLNSIEDALFIEDHYFIKNVVERKIKKHILIRVTNLEDIKNKEYPFPNNEKYSENDKFILSKYDLINYCRDSFTSDDIDMKLMCDLEKENVEIKINFDNKDYYFKELIKNSKIPSDFREDMFKVILKKIFMKINSKNKNIEAGINQERIFLCSTNYSLLHLINCINYPIGEILESTDYSSQSNKFNNEHNQRLFKKTENIIYKNFDNFMNEKLIFLIKKSYKYYNEFCLFKNQLFDNIVEYNTREINHYLSSFKSYSTIINDILNIPFYSCSQLENDLIELKANLLIFRNIIDKQYESYEDDLLMFYSNFSKEFEEFFKENLLALAEERKKIYFYTTSKINQMSEKYQLFFKELVKKLEFYLNEILERDMRFIIFVKEELKSKGYLNEYLSQFLANIQISLMNFIEEAEVSGDKLNDFIFSLGLSGGLGLASGLVTLGVTRLLAAIGSDALAGSAGGPIGTIAGTAVGTLSFIGTTFYSSYNNKKEYLSRENELREKAYKLKEIIYDKMEEFRYYNKSEIFNRIKKIMSYLELTLKISIKASQKNTSIQI